MMPGRTHGVHAEPLSLGVKLANHYDEVRRGRARLAAAASEVSVGQVSGPVGTYTSVPPEVEEHVCRGLGLAVADAATQVLARDRHAAFVASVAILGASLERLATTVRLLQQTEISELEEPFAQRQKGSSAMPHKHNPVLSERVCGMARVLRGYAVTAMEDVALWHERDISHSSAERIIIPDSTTLADYLLNKTANLIETMFVYPERMLANLGSTRGLVFSGQLLLDLVESGISREDAYRLVQSHAMRAWKEDLDFHELVLGDPAIAGRVPRAKIERAFDLRRQLKNIDKIFARVFPEKKSREDRASKSRNKKTQKSRK